MRLTITSTPSSVAHRPRERRAALEPEPVECPRALDREQREVVGDVADVRAAKLALLQPAKVGLAIRGVDDQQVAVPVEPVDDQVVDDPAVLGRQQRVLRLADRDPVDVVRQRRLQQIARGRALDLDLAHVRDVEDAGVGSEPPGARR